MAKVFAGTCVTCGAGAFAFSEFMKAEYGAEALPRLLTAYAVGVPGFLAYKFTQFKFETVPTALGWKVDDVAAARAYETLHDEWAPKGLAVILNLRGFNLKTGQMVASNFGNVFPEKWQKTFEPLLDHVPHKPFPVVRHVVERELGRTIEDLFSSFDEDPIAAASIGQVPCLHHLLKNPSLNTLYSCKLNKVL